MSASSRTFRYDAMVENISSTRKFSYAFVCMFVLHTILRIFFESKYQVNDDTAILSFLNGTFTGNNEANTVFVHPWIGETLASLYRSSPTVTWYPYFLLLITMVALSSLAFFVNNDATLFTWLIAAFLTVSSLTIEPTFTVASLICAVTGLVGIWLSSLQKNAKIRINGILAFSIVTFIAFLLRKQSILFSIGFISPLIIAVWYLMARKNVFVRRSVIVATLFILVTCLSSLLAHKVQFICKSEENCTAWQEYTAFNQARGAIHGTPNASMLRGNLNELGWSLNDFNLFASWLHPDDKETFFYPISNMTSATQSPISIVTNQELLATGISNFFGGASNFIISLIVFLRLFFLLVNRYRIPFRNGLIGITVSGWFLLGLMISSLYRFPLRISFPFLVSAVIVAFAVLVLFEQIEERSPLWPEHRSKTRKMSRKSIGVDYLVILLTVTISVIPFVGETGMLQRSYVAQELNFDAIDFQKDIRVASLDSNILISPGFSHLYSINPWKNENWFFENNSLSFGWPVFSPHQEARQEGLGIKSMFKDLLDAKEEYFFCGSETEAGLIAKYLTEKGQIDVSAHRMNTRIKFCESWEFRSVP